MMKELKQATSLNVAILKVSNKELSGADPSSEYIASELIQAGHQIAAQKVLSNDKYFLRAKVSTWIADNNIDVVLTLGGTGFSQTDVVPEALVPLFDKTVDGFGELFRSLSFAEIGTSTLKSRAVAGMANSTFIFCLPSSLGACQTAWQGILKEQLDNQHRPCNFVCHTNAPNRSELTC